jgi:hypothetical protein
MMGVFVGLRARKWTTDRRTLGSRTGHSSRALSISSDFGTRVLSYLVLLLFTAVIPCLSSRIRSAQAPIASCDEK